MELVMARVVLGHHLLHSRLDAHNQSGFRGRVGLRNGHRVRVAQTIGGHCEEIKRSCEAKGGDGGREQEDGRDYKR